METKAIQCTLIIVNKNKDMNTVILTLSLHKLPQYIKVNETVIESTKYMSKINEILLCILKIKDFSS